MKKKPHVWAGADSFGKEMLEQLQKGIGPHTKGHGFHFPGTTEKWTPIFQKAIFNAQLTFSKSSECEGHEAYELKGAFQEYVYSLLQKYVEVDAAKKLIDHGIKNPTVTAIRACKENIDRGGAANMLYMHLSLDTSTPLKDKLTLALGALSRSIAYKNR